MAGFSFKGLFKKFVGIFVKNKFTGDLLTFSQNIGINKREVVEYAYNLINNPSSGVKTTWDLAMQLKLRFGHGLKLENLAAFKQNYNLQWFSIDRSHFIKVINEWELGNTILKDKLNAFKNSAENNWEAQEAFYKFCQDLGVEITASTRYMLIDYIDEVLKIR